jgi:hypothetical protein
MKGLTDAEFGRRHGSEQQRQAVLLAACEQAGRARLATMRGSTRVAAAKQSSFQFMMRIRTS